MRIAITGTPGTGKTSVTELLENEYEVIHLNELIRENELTNGYDEERNSYLVDLEALEETLPQEGVFESHISHLLDVDKTIVLRCHPKQLQERLSDEPEKEIRENVEAEAIDGVLIEALDQNKEVHEIDTTERSVKEVAGLIDQIIRNEKTMEPGRIDWSKWLMEEHNVK